MANLNQWVEKDEENYDDVFVGEIKSANVPVSSFQILKMPDIQISLLIASHKFSVENIV